VGDKDSDGFYYSSKGERWWILCLAYPPLSALGGSSITKAFAEYHLVYEDLGLKVLLSSPYFAGMYNWRELIIFICNDIAKSIPALH
jgi:hypothetical protein